MRKFKLLGKSIKCIYFIKVFGVKKIACLSKKHKKHIFFLDIQSRFQYIKYL